MSHAFYFRVQHFHVLHFHPLAISMVRHLLALPGVLSLSFSRPTLSVDTCPSAGANAITLGNSHSQRNAYFCCSKYGILINDIATITKEYVRIVGMPIS